MEFYEVQRFRNRWIRFSIAALTIGFIIYFGKGAIQQLVYGKPWGSKPLSDFALVLTGSIILLVMIALCFFFFSLKLVTVVDEQGLHIALFPLSKQLIPFQQIIKCKSTTYNPIQDYGGWGVRYGQRGKAYTIYGNRGVLLELADNGTLLVGSQRPEELYQCITQHLE